MNLFDALLFLSVVIQAEAGSDRHNLEEVINRIDRNLERLCEICADKKRSE